MKPWLVAVLGPLVTLLFTMPALADLEFLRLSKIQHGRTQQILDAS
ncbi:MAG: hypothetical protein O7H39_18420 [Gammaproteobacteria bacterium]|nr:hypothetical protein [Gammaproteobacteria bacterium]